MAILGYHYIQKKVFLNSDEENRSRVRQLGTFITIPFVLAIPPVLGWFIGRWMDGLLGSTPFVMYLMICLGFVAGFREVYRIIKRFGNGA